jgi:hypothetical protein
LAGNTTLTHLALNEVGVNHSAASNSYFHSFLSSRIEVLTHKLTSILPVLADQGQTVRKVFKGTPTPPLLELPCICTLIKSSFAGEFQFKRAESPE